MKGIKHLMYLCLVCTMASKAISQFSVSAELRPRTEYRNGYKAPMDTGTKPAFITSQRSRLGFSFTRDKIQSFIAIQDVRVWGESGVKNDLSNLGLYEAWAEIPFAGYFAVKLGRQELVYDDQRLLSNTNWNNVGSSHDLVLLKFKKNNIETHCGLAYNQDKEKYSASQYAINYFKTLSFLWLSKKISGQLHGSIIIIVDGNENQKNNNPLYFRTTAGFYANYSNQIADASASAYLQGGKDVSGNTVRAHFFSLKSTINLTDDWSIGLGTDYFSGNKALDTIISVNHAFNNLYGSGHRFLGSMDYFTSVEKHTLGTGLINPFIGCSYQVNEMLVPQFNVLAFWLNGNELYDGQNALLRINPFLGKELDLTIKIKLNKVLEIKTGYSCFFGTRTLNIVKGGEIYDYADWIWIMLTFKMN